VEEIAMKALFDWCKARSLWPARNRRPAKQRRRTALRLESLERRELFSIAPYPIQEMTQLAAMFGPHNGPTKLCLNFDGNTAEHVAAFNGADQDIQEVMYRTAEIFAPFDVQVYRIFGNGVTKNSNQGHTTVFIGDDTDNGTGTNNRSRAFTPWGSADWPGTQRGFSHAPNSDPNDVAFVDPVFFGGAFGLGREPNFTIAQSIAHEAGHTFGLVHVLSNPIQDIMSYNAGNVAFRNSTFQITADNFNGTSVYSEPGMIPYWLTHLPWQPNVVAAMPIGLQNSYMYLSVTLGLRDTTKDINNVADTLSVDPSFQEGPMVSVKLWGATTAEINRWGDYDVFRFTASSAQSIKVQVENQAGFMLDPALLVFDQTGRTLVQYNDNAYAGATDAYVTFDSQAGATYFFVVGAHNGQGQGLYRISVKPAVATVVQPPRSAWTPGLLSDVWSPPSPRGPAPLPQGASSQTMRTDWVATVEPQLAASVAVPEVASPLPWSDLLRLNSRETRRRSAADLLVRPLGESWANAVDVCFARRELAMSR
jgi:hypothetical protein